MKLKNKGNILKNRVKKKIVKMYVRFVPVNGADFKHAKIQLDPNETVTNIREKLAKHFNIENFKVLYHGRLVSDLTQTGIFYKMNANSTLHIIESAASNAPRYDLQGRHQDFNQTKAKIQNFNWS